MMMVLVSGLSPMVLSILVVWCGPSEFWFEAWGFCSRLGMRVVGLRKGVTIMIGLSFVAGSRMVD